MKNIFLCVIISLILTSCDFGWSDFFGRDYQVNTRTERLMDLNGTEFAPSVSSETFSVLVFTDIHFGRKSNTEQAKACGNFINFVNNEKQKLSNDFPIAFITCLGDTTKSAKTDDFKKYVSFVSDIKAKTSIQVYTVIGNHDLYNDGYLFFKKNIYPYETAYTFRTSFNGNFMNWYFIDTANGTLGKEQLQNFMNKLENDSGDKIVFGHHPLYAGGIIYFTLQNINERDSLISSFAKNNVKFYLAGHCHKEHEFKYKDYFYEKTAACFFDTHNVLLIKVDMKNKKSTVESLYF